MSRQYAPFRLQMNILRYGDELKNNEITYKRCLEFHLKQMYSYHEQVSDKDVVGQFAMMVKWYYARYDFVEPEVHSIEGSTIRYKNFNQ